MAQFSWEHWNDDTVGTKSTEQSVGLAGVDGHLMVKHNNFFIK